MLSFTENPILSFFLHFLIYSDLTFLSLVDAFSSTATCTCMSPFKSSTFSITVFPVIMSFPHLLSPLSQVDIDSQLYKPPKYWCLWKIRSLYRLLSRRAKSGLEFDFIVLEIILCHVILFWPICTHLIFLFTAYLVPLFSFCFFLCFLSGRHADHEGTSCLTRTSLDNVRDL